MSSVTKSPNENVIQFSTETVDGIKKLIVNFIYELLRFLRLVIPNHGVGFEGIRIEGYKEMIKNKKEELKLETLKNKIFNSLKLNKDEINVIFGSVFQMFNSLLENRESLTVYFDGENILLLNVIRLMRSLYPKNPTNNKLKWVAYFSSSKTDYNRILDLKNFIRYIGKIRIMDCDEYDFSGAASREIVAEGLQKNSIIFGNLPR